MGVHNWFRTLYLVLYIGSALNYIKLYLLESRRILLNFESMCQCHCYKIYRVCVFHLVSCHLKYHVTNVIRGILWATNKLSDSRSKVKVIITFFYMRLVDILSFYPRSLERGGGSILFYVCPSVQDIFRCIFLSNYRWQKSDIWSQASYRYAILWVPFLDPSDSYFLFADLVGFYTHWTYIHIFLSSYWWHKSDIWSQASYWYPISWEAFLDPSDSYFLFADLIFIHIEHIC